ncbi:unnamed protein product [Leptosia nina]|uniref:TIMELESS-interacting protein n=1 Tax=Leptosia nina TaxID=320188 RepID=A0AAV1JFW0_9NEOP
MSLLEDIFLRDEENEAHELERVIEGGDYEERAASNSDDNSEKEDEAEEEKRRVDPASNKTKRVVKNPRFVLNPARLTGPRGIQVIPEHFKDFKFKGKGHEKEDLDLVLKKLEHWAYRLYPKFKFEDCLKKIETLGKKRIVMVHLHKIRSDQLNTEEIVVQNDSSDDETQPQQEPDEFDKLLQQQIELARSTPAPKVNKSIEGSSIENRSLIVPKVMSSPSISAEQRERMLRNRQRAEERRLAKLNNSTSANINEVEACKPANHDEIVVGNVKCHTNNQDDKCTINDNNENDTSKTQAIIRSHESNHSDKEPAYVHQDKYDYAEPLDNLHVTESQPKKRRSNVLDSSDDEIEPDVNIDESEPRRSETVNVKVMLHAKKRKNNIVDSSDEENTSYLPVSEASQSNKEKTKISEDRGENDRSTRKDNECDSDRLINNSNQENIDVREVVLENSIIQSTIQGLVENDNNLNLERDQGTREENAGSSNIDENVLMDVDFTDEF